MRSLNHSNNIDHSIKKIDWLLTLKKDFYFISELKMSCSIRNQALVAYLQANKFGSYSFLFNSSSNSRGVGIIYSNHLDLVIHSIHKDPNENFIIIDTTVNGMRLTVGSVYLPSKAPDHVLLSLTQTIDSLGNHLRIIGGDFNLTPSDDPVHLNLDIHNHVGCNVRGSSIIKDWMQLNNLVEPFRFSHPHTKEFSFSRGKGSTASKSRIDFFIISIELVKVLQDTSYLLMPNCTFDHKAVIMNFRNSHNNPYRIFISEAIANDKECLRIAKMATWNIIKLYWEGDQNEDIAEILNDLNTLNYEIFHLRRHLANNFDALLSAILDTKLDKFNNRAQLIDINSLINPWRLSVTPPACLELLLNDIKMHISDYGKLDTIAKRKKKDRLLNKLYEEKNAPTYNSNYIDELEHKLAGLMKDSMGILTKYSRISTQNLSMGNISAISNALSRTTPKSIESLVDDHGNDFQSDSSRDEYIYNYYRNIYSKIPDTTCSISEFMNSHGSIALMPIREENLFQALTCEISATEVRDTVSQQNGGSSPGLDQVSATLIKKISPAILPLLVISFNFVLTGQGDFSASAKATKIRLIPKNHKSESIRNWRPISLTNNIFKLYSKILAKRVSSILPKILGYSQKAYM